MHKNTEISNENKENQSFWEKSNNSIFIGKPDQRSGENKLEDGSEPAIGISKASTTLPHPEDTSKIYLANNRDSICLDLKVDPLTTRKTGVIEYLEKKFKRPANQLDIDVSMSHIPKRQALVAFLLLIAGMVTLITGIIIAVNKRNGSKSTGFWILAGICLLPGGYYTIKYIILHRAIKAKRANSGLANVQPQI